MTADEQLATDLGDIVTRLANFRAVVLGDSPSNSEQVVPMLVQIDSDLESWARALPFTWRFQVEQCISRDEFYLHCHHKYSGFTIATVWNQYRIARCLANDLLLTCLASSCPATPDCDPILWMEKSDQARELIQEFCTDICVSVSYFLRQVNQARLPKPGVGALEIMWALFVCARMIDIPDQQRAWAIRHLEIIGQQLGVHQALLLANWTRFRSTPDKPRHD
jgi:hypothetical protein